MGFTRETARAAAAKRRAKRASAAASDIASPADPPAEEPRVPTSMHGGLPPLETATVVVTPPPPPEPTPEPEPAAADPAIAKPEVVEVTGTPFTPDVVKMFTNIAFDAVGVVTGKPHIWKLDPEELDPLVGPMGHQLSRIPLVRALGPDNTELVIVTMGLGVIVTKRLNEHADENERERQEKARRLAAGETPSRGDVAPSRSAPAPAAPAGEFATEGGGVHIGMSVPAPARAH